MVAARPFCGSLGENIGNKQHQHQHCLIKKTKTKTKHTKANKQKNYSNMTEHNKATGSGCPQF